MRWFKHDTDASNDAKVKKLLIKYGVTGYAIYFHCIELIANDISEHNITFELEHDSEIIADNLKIKGTADKSGIEIVEEIMRYIVDLGLFMERNDKIFCYKLLKRLDTSMTSNAKFRALITEAKESHDLVMIESCKTRTDKKRRDKKEEPSPKKIDIEYIELATLLYSLHKQQDNGYHKTEAELHGWADDIRKLCEIDKRSVEEIERVMRWAKQPDCFWFPNIQSGKKLRSQFDTMLAQMKQKSKTTTPQPTHSIPEPALNPRVMAVVDKMNNNA